MVALTMMIVGVLFLVLIAWNVIFLEVSLVDGYQGDIFRGVYRNFRSPIYGGPETPHASDVVLLALPLSVFGAAVATAWRRDCLSMLGFGLLVCTLQLVMIGAFALTQSSERLAGVERDYESFALIDDLEQFESLADVFPTWNATMPTMHLRNRHYPPGNLFVMKVEKELGWDGLFRAIVVALTLATTVLMAPLARALDLGRRGQQMAMMLLATSTGPLVFPTSFTAPMTMFFAAGIYAALLRSLRRSSRSNAVIAGLLLAVCALFSFVFVTIGLVVGCVLVVGVVAGRFPFVTALRTAVLIVVTMIGALAMVRLLLGFDIVDCLSVARSNASDLMGASSFDSMPRYLLRSSGNILAYLIYSGVVVSALAAAAIRQANAPLVRSVGIATLGALVVAGFAGQFWLETERIWIFFTPLMAVLAAAALHGSKPGDDPELPIVAGNALSASSQELYHLHYV